MSSSSNSATVGIARVDDVDVDVDVDVVVDGVVDVIVDVVVDVDVDVVVDVDANNAEVESDDGDDDDDKGDNDAKVVWFEVRSSSLTGVGVALPPTCPLSPDPIKH